MVGTARCAVRESVKSVENRLAMNPKLEGRFADGAARRPYHFTNHSGRVSANRTRSAPLAGIQPRKSFGSFA